MWPKSRPRRPAGCCGKQQREKNPVRKEETRPRSMSLLSEKTCPDNGGNLTWRQHHRRTERIRLSGIDCPEKGQAFGKKAKQAASDLAFGKDVTIQTHGYDKYKRTRGDVILPDGTNVNQELVKQGWC